MDTIQQARKNRFRRLGPHQRNMIGFIVRNGCKRYSISQDHFTRNVANSLEKRGIIVVNRDFECWTIRIPRTLFQAAKRLGTNDTNTTRSH